MSLIEFLTKVNAKKVNVHTEGVPVPMPVPMPTLEHATSASVVVDKAASTPEAAQRFLAAIGFGHLVGRGGKVSLLNMVELSTAELQELFGIERRCEAVALRDECQKLNYVLKRTSEAIDYPMWLPIVLSVPHDSLAPRPYDPQRVQSARGHRYHKRATSAGGSHSARKEARPLTASERLRFMMSGVPPPLPSAEERHEQRAKRRYAYEALVTCQAQHRALLQQHGGGGPPPPTAAHPTAAGPVTGASSVHERLPDTTPNPARPVRSRLPDHAAAAAAEAAKSAVLALVGEREAALGAMRALLPTPKGTVATRRASLELLSDPAAFAQLRADLAILMHEMRRTSAAVCRAIHEWKLTLRSRYVYFATLSEESLSFYVGGVDYMRKMCTDLAFLPAPSSQDPLLLHWFGEQLPWMLAFGQPPSFEPGLAKACDAPIVSFDARRAPSAHESVREREHALAQLAAAQKDLLEVGAKHGTLCAPSALPRLARAPAAPGADAPTLGQRWQYEAFQALLYGGVLYVPLLRGLPQWFTHRALTDAALTVQHMYRNRLVRKFRRTLLETRDHEAKLKNIAAAKKQLRSALFLQGAWRRVCLRREVKKRRDAKRLEEKRRKSAHESEAARLVAFRDQRRLEEDAIIKLQRRWKVRLCKKTADNRRKERSLSHSNASTLMAQTHSVALLEKVMARHRAAMSVMASVYSQVCLGYEVKGLERLDERQRSKAWHITLLKAQTKVDTDQYRAEMAARALLAHSCELNKEAASADDPAAVGNLMPPADGARPKTAAAGRSGADMAAAVFGSVTVGGVMTDGRPTSERIATMEEMAEQAMRHGPDGLPRVDVLQAEENAKAKLSAASFEYERLIAEVEAWEKTVNLIKTIKSKPLSPQGRRVPGQLSLTEEGLLDVPVLRELYDKVQASLEESRRSMRAKVAAADRMASERKVRSMIWGKQATMSNLLEAAKKSSPPKTSMPAMPTAKNLLLAAAGKAVSPTRALSPEAIESTPKEFPTGTPQAHEVEAMGEAFFVLTGGERRTLALPWRLHLVEGACAQLEEAETWDDAPVETIAGQRRMWLAGARALRALTSQIARARDDADATTRDLARREGVASPIVELTRLMDVIEQRQATIQFLAGELAQRVPFSHKLRDVCAKLHAVNEPPVPAPPTNPEKLELWDQWMEEVISTFATFKQGVHNIDGCVRLTVARQEAQRLQAKVDLLEKQHTQLGRHCLEWIQAEGAIRVLVSLQDPERLRLKRVLLGKRSDAYRRRCAEPVNTKVQYKAATRDLCVVEEAEILANEIESSAVQVRTECALSATECD